MVVEVNEADVEVNDVVDENVTVLEAEVIETESVMDKIKQFGSKHKKPLFIAGAIVLGLSAVVAKALFFPGDALDLEDGADEDTDADIEVE